MVRILIVLTGWELAMTKCHVSEEYTGGVLEAGSGEMLAVQFYLIMPH